MSLRVEVVNAAEVTTHLRKMGKGVEECAAEAQEDMVLEADRLAKTHARSKTEKPIPRTRRYLNSIHAEISRTGFRVTGVIASNVVYAPYLEEGTDPHEIRPKNKKALFWPGARHPVKVVRHPGNEGYHVLGGAAEKVVKDMGAFLSNCIQKKFGND